MKDVEVDLLKSNAIEYINCHFRESATFERLFSQIELVKNRLQCVSAQLIRIAFGYFWTQEQTYSIGYRP